MPRIVFGSLLTAAVLLCQGIYTLRTGQTSLFFAKPGAQAPSRAIRRFVSAFLYLFPAASIAVILASALARSGVSPLRSWLVENLEVLLSSLCFSVVGLLSFSKPEGMIRWTLRDRRELAGSRLAVMIWRVLGACFVWMAILMLPGR